MKTLTLDLADRSYPIYIGENLLTQPELFAPHLAAGPLLVVSNSTVAPLYLRTLLELFPGKQICHLELPDGESFKSMETLQTIFDFALQNRLSRDATFIALGGGVVGDITGFAAACYQRGVKFLQVPTTLLAQVDSSVGGKTAVNHPLGKNMIGSFHQPICVVIDTCTLGTLPQREYISGLAEVIKYGLLHDADFFTWLEQNMDALLQREPVALSHAIEHSCHIKALIVSADERETGARALLNLGHTFAHAIENGLGYGRWLHGEAVATGCCMAADLSMRHGWVGQADLVRIYQLFKTSGLPVSAPSELSPAQMFDLMHLDKKVRSGQMPLVLLKSLGKASLVFDYELSKLQSTLTMCRSEQGSSV